MIRDPLLILNGYQAHLTRPGTGLFTLTHNRPDCNTTISVQVNNFRSYYSGTIPTIRNIDNPSCPGYCKDPNNFHTCSIDCDLRWIRDVMQMFKQHTLLPTYSEDVSK